MSAEELVARTALEQLQALETGELSARELVRAYLDRIERFDRHVQAFLLVDAD